MDYFFDHYLSKQLRKQYNFYLVQGTDRKTGHNVAMLTKVDPIEDITRYEGATKYPNPNTLCPDQQDIGYMTAQRSRFQICAIGMSKIEILNFV